jgi:presenilin-like A22 family membrane protease
MIQSVVGIKNRILKNDAAFLIGFSVALMPNLLIGSSSYQISDTVNSILAL